MGALDPLDFAMLDGMLLAGEAIALGVEPPPRLSVTEWADAHRRLPTKGAGEPGPWRKSWIACLPSIRQSASSS